MLISIYVQTKKTNNKKALIMTKTISIKTTNKALSPHGGLIYFNDMVGKIKFQEQLSDVLPQTGKKQFQKFKSLLLGFICGLDSIDDISKLRQDRLFWELTQGACADSTMGDFLRAFSERQIEQLNELLFKMASEMRELILSEENFIIYSSDSTPNEQCGKKMEGLGWNYKKQWGLDTLGIYDHHGLHYGMDVREGGTYSSNGHSLLLGNILRNTNNSLKKFFHGDSAFSNLEHYNTLLNGDCKFVMALSELSYGPLLRGHLNWQKTELEFFNSKDCELAHCLYYVKGLRGGKKSLRVVLIRAKNSQEQQDLFGSIYRHYALVTNIGAHEKLPVMKKRRYRGKEVSKNNLNNYSIFAIIFYMEEITKEWLKVFETLNESQRRWIAGVKSIEIGRGGISAVAEATNLSRTTVTKGVKEVKGPQKNLLYERTRKEGGGRKRIDTTDSSIKKGLEDILSETTAGDPMTLIRWTGKSVRKIAEQLSKNGHLISHHTVHNLLREMGYSLQSNRKSLSRENNPNRDRQFKIINRKVKKFIREGMPVVSVDTKKKELVGKFKNQGKTWKKKGVPHLVEDHDFPSRST